MEQLPKKISIYYGGKLKFNSTVFKENLIRDFLIGAFISLGFTLLFGVDVAHLFIWFLIFIVISLLVNLVRLTLAKFKDYEKFLNRLVTYFLIAAITIGLHQAQKFVSNINFDEDIKTIEAYSTKHGQYPESLDVANTSNNPYFSLFGPKYRYHPPNERREHPTLCKIFLSPFGRVCYNFESKGKIVVD